MPESFSPEDLSGFSSTLKMTSRLERSPIHKDIGELPVRKRKEMSHDKNSSQKNRLYPEVPEESDEETEEVIEKSKASVKYKQNKEQSKSSIFKYLLSVLLIKSKSSIFKYLLSVLLIIITLWKFSMLRTSDSTANASVDQIIENMKNNFKNQNPITYRIVKSALKKVVNVSNEPSAPAIFTVVANKNAESRAAEFSLYLARALATKNYVLINESVYWHSNPDDIKLKIDEDIRSKMENNTLNVVIVDKLHNIPYEAAMIFHGYCDHILAPYKRAVFLFNVPLSVILPEDASSKQIDAAAMRQLRNIWQRATSDVIDSLITRVTVNVINIR